MGLENFVPKIWSAKLLVRLRKTMVFSSVVNTDYEGEITQFGDTVKINELGTVTISDYSKYAALTWQALDSAQKILLIDKAKSFSFTIDDIDTAQQNPKVMNAAMAEAAYAMSDAIDQDIAGLYTDAGITNTTNMGSSASAKSVSSGNVVEVLSYAKRYMDEANVPAANRVAVIPPWFHQKLLMAEVGGISASAVPKVFDDGRLVSGSVGPCMGFELVLSNNVAASATGVSAIMCLHRLAISYAGQLTKIEPVKRESYFDEGVKGLYVYGTKVVRPDALAVIHASEASG